MLLILLFGSLHNFYIDLCIYAGFKDARPTGPDKFGRNPDSIATSPVGSD